MIGHWASESWGQMARIPDFMANIVVGLYDARDRLAAVDPRLGDSAVWYHRHCPDADLALAHSIVDPRSAEFVIWFATPIATPGLKLLCREPMSCTPAATATRWRAGSTSRTRWRSSTTS